MKRYFLIVFVLCSISIFADPQVKERLSLLYSPKVLQQIVKPVDEWHPFPKYEEREAWQNFSQEIKSNLIRIGDKALKKEWPELTATLYLDYLRTGNRSKYQNVEGRRRAILIDLVFAELIEGEGRFLDPIVNAVWSICEQSSWTLPAHVTPGLPNVEDPIVALISGEMGAKLAWIHYLFQATFDEISPRINARIRHEIDHRILIPCHNRDDFWWMGFGRGMINNWNSWCNSNWLTCILLAEQDSTQKYQDLHKCLKSLDRFLDTRPADGGCDEGPSYWNHAAGTMFIALEVLNGITDRRLNIFKDPLIRNLGDYIAKVHIYNNYFVNFADASGKVKVDGFLLYRYGDLVRNNDLKALGIESIQTGNSYTYKDGYNIYRRLHALFLHDNLTKKTIDAKLSIDSYLPDTQVVTARNCPQKDKGLFLAAKGGHNAESHNHNDVGNFIIYKNGEPFIIDVGVETYTKKTFSNERYTIWTMNSNYHNLPTINGVVQKNGSVFKAEDVNYKGNQKRITFSLDIANAYPEEAGVKTWKRELLFKREEKGQIELSDSYELSHFHQPHQLHLMCLEKPVLEQVGSIKMTSESDSHLSIQYEPDKFDVVIEEIQLEDANLTKVWGDKIYRIHMTLKSDSLKDQYKMIFN